MDEKPVSRRSILAVWHWPRWVWVSIAVACVIYPLTAMPFIFFALRAGFSDPEVASFTTIAYAPVIYASENIPAVSQFLGWQLNMLEWLVDGTVYE